MHKSRLSGICIDCKTDDLAREAAFWSAALGSPALPEDMEANGRYVGLKTREGDVMVVLQKVDHAPRVHLDFETDDRAAEVERIEALGARVVEKMERWTVMEAPSGHRFCVCDAQTETLPETGNAWG